MIAANPGASNGQLLYNSTYITLNASPCARLLNATGTIGCQSPRNGVSGIVYGVPSDNDLEAFIANPPSGGNHALLLPIRYFVPDTIDRLMKTKKVSGIIVILSNATRPSSYSPDVSCPNCEFGMYAGQNTQTQWNPNGNGLIYRTYDIPIFATSPSHDSTYSALMRAVESNSKGGYRTFPMYSVEFDAFMYSAYDAPTCLRRGWCAPVGGYSIYSTASSAISRTDNRPIIMMSTGMNERTFFHDESIGAEAAISGVVGLLAIAEALSRAPAPSTGHLLFTFFHSEGWGYAGSQRFWSDVEAGGTFTCDVPFSKNTPGCPYKEAACASPCRRDLDYTHINPDSLNTILELGPIGHMNLPPPLNTSNRFYAHTHTTSAPNTALAQALNSSGLRPLINIPSSSQGLPPSSAQSILRTRPNIRHAVLTDYENPGDRSIWQADLDDVYVPMSWESVCSIANSTARAAWSLAQTGGGNGTGIPSSLNVNCTLVDTLMDCLINNFSCPLVRQFTPTNEPVGKTAHYSIFQHRSMDWTTSFVYAYMYNLTATVREGSCESVADCREGQECVASQCLWGMTRLHDAYGMGLKMDANTGVFTVEDPTKATWVESLWDPVVFRLFLVTSKGMQILELMVGLILTVGAIGLTLWGRKAAAKSLKVA
ncbi:Nicastrin-domain-containing protein [Piptocephalis cylindrospora]|uniref:Nicastrin n=1 Tax=Piptocephalis cylindrospora TaxID=1907219 RepID=A0A4P9Y3N6_9FUNG|nr:Nicastrin-domain-containing protein [Piptocephalis cylindrospora]|eukprot:RKP13537.1 Nicastrin-domain-containing protein [Piptocephalis cylindrospora]